MHGAHHSRPGGTHRQVPAFIGTAAVAFRIDDVGLNAGQGQGGGAGLGGRCPRQGADHHPAGFGLPPGVDDRAAVASNHVAVPHPGLRIDRFANGAEQAKAAHVELIRNGAAALHERPDCGGSRVEDRDLVFLDQLPEGTGLGRSRRTLVHHRRGTVRQGAVDDVAVAGDPTHIGRTPEDILIPDVEDPLEGEVGPEVVAGGGVHNALGLAGGAGGVEHEQAVLAGHRLSGAVGTLTLHQVMPPLIATGDHLHVLLGALHHKHAGHRGAGAIGQRRIHRGLE